MTDDRIEGTALTESERADRNGATVDAEQAEVAELRRRLVGMDKMADARTDLLVKAEGQRDQARAEAARLRAEVDDLRAKLATEEGRNLDLLALLAAYKRLDWQQGHLIGPIEIDEVVAFMRSRTAVDALPPQAEPAPSTPDAD